MKHTNKIAINILSEEYRDYKYNQWHYDRDYKMIVKAIELSKIENEKQLLIDFKKWEVENNIKNLLPEQLAEFYIEENTLCPNCIDNDFCKNENGCLKDKGFT